MLYGFAIIIAIFASVAGVDKGYIGVLHGNGFVNNNSNRRMYCISIAIGIGKGNIIWVWLGY